MAVGGLDQFLFSHGQQPSPLGSGNIVIYKCISGTGPKKDIPSQSQRVSGAPIITLQSVTLCSFHPPGALPNARSDFNLASPPSISLSFFSFFSFPFPSGLPIVTHILLRFPIRPEGRCFSRTRSFGKPLLIALLALFLCHFLVYIHSTRDWFAVPLMYVHTIALICI